MKLKEGKLIASKIVMLRSARKEYQKVKNSRKKLK